MELGNSLEDGTTLGQYSEALNKVGINIKSVNGEVKSMDTILNEMGSKWDSINKGQQIALAQTVAGVRQYTQLIALMDNWDTFQTNLVTAQTAEGTLQEQQDIWAESWEAASNRVKSGAESLYDTLVNDDFFIDLNNIFADLLSTMSEFIDGLGGLKVILPSIAGALLSAFGPKMVDSIINFKNSLFGPSKNIQAEATALRNEALKENSLMTTNSTSQANQTGSMVSKANLEIVQEVERIQRKLTDNEVAQIQGIIDQNKGYQTQLMELAEIIDKKKEILQLSEQNINTARYEVSTTTKPENAGEMNKVLDSIETTTKEGVQLNKDVNKFSNTVYETPKARQNAATSLLDSITGSGVDSDVLSGVFSKEDQELLLGFADGTNTNTKAFTELQAKLRTVNIEERQYIANIEKGKEAVQNYSSDIQKGNRSMTNFIKNTRTSAQTTEELNNQTNALSKSSKKYQQQQQKTLSGIEEFSKMKPGEIFTGLAGGMASAFASVQMLYSGVSNLVEMFKTGKHSIGGWLGALTSMLFAVPMLSTAFATIGKALKDVILTEQNHINSTTKDTSTTLASIIVGKIKNKTTDQGEKETREEAAAIAFKEKELSKLNAEELKSIGIEKVKNGFKKTDGTGANIKQGKKGAISGSTKVGDLEKAGDVSESGIKNALNGGGQEGFGGKIGDNFKTGGSNIKGFLSANKDALFKFGAQAGIAAVAVAAIAAGIYLTVKALNAHKEAAKKAAAAAKYLKEEYSKASEATTQLKDNISSYEELTQKTRELTKGTYEYKQALLEANSKALELIQSNKTLQEPGSYEIVNGEIRISEEAMQKAQEEQLREQQEALAISNSAEIASKQADYDAKQVEALKKTSSGADFDEGSLWGVGLGALALGAAMLLTGPIGIGLAIAAGATMVGSGIAGFAVGDDEEEERKAVEKLNEQYEDNPNMFASKENLREALGPEFADLTDTLWENKTSIQNLVTSNQELKQQTELLRLQMATTTRESLFPDLDSELQGAVDIGIAEAQGSKEAKKAEIELYGLINYQDGLLMDLYNSIHEDEGLKLTTKTGDSAIVTDKEGNEKEVKQSTIARQLTSELQMIYYYGTKEEQGNIENIVKTASNVSGEHETEIIEQLQAFANISDNLSDIVERQQHLQSQIKTIEGFNGVKNSESRSILLEAIETGRGELEDTDFSQLSRDQIEALQGNLNRFGPETQKIINQGIETYEAKRKNANVKTSIKFDSMVDDATKRANELSEASISELDFSAYVDNISETYKVGEERAEQLALANLKVKNGLTDLQKTHKDYNEYLTESYKGTLQYSKGIAAVQKDLKTWLGVEFDFSTVETNLDLISKALNGDAQAVEDLQKLAAKQFIIDLDLDTADAEEAINAITGLQGAEIKAGMTLDTTEAGKSLMQFYEQMLVMGKMSSADVKNSLEALGYVVKTTKKEVKNTDKNWWQFWKSSTKEVDWIDWKATYYGGDFTDNAIDFSPIEGETKSEKSKRLKDLDKELERYHEIDEIIQDIERDLDALSKAKDRAYGKDKLSLLDSEIAKNKELLSQTEERLRQAKEYFAIDQQKAASFGAIMDDNGVITNYEELIEAQVNKLKGLSKDDAGYDAAEQYLDDMKEAFSQYEETLDTVKDAEQELIDKHNELIDAVLEKVEYQVDFKIQVDDWSKKVVDSLLADLDDDAYAAAESIKLIGDQMAITAGQIDTYTDAIHDTLAATFSEDEISRIMAGDATGIDISKLTDDQMQKLYDYGENLLDLKESLIEGEKKVHENLTELMEQQNEDFNKEMSKFERYSKTIEHYKNIIDITGKDHLGISDETLLSMANTQAKIANDQMIASKARKEAAEQTYAEMRASYENALKMYGADSEITKNWKAQMDAAKETMDDAVDSFQENLEASLQAIKDAFSQQAEMIKNAFEKAVSGKYGSIDLMSEMYEEQKETSELYLKDYEKIYQISKLNRQINKDISNTSSLKNSKELQELQSELLDMQNSGQKISQNELTFMQKKYELLVAEQALRDVQNNKATVRLRRDSEGNYGYTYTADQNAVADAQQKIDDARYAIQDYANKWDQELADSWLKLVQWHSNGLAEIEAMTDLSEEQRVIRKKELEEQFQERAKYIQEQGISMNRMATDANIQFNLELADSYNETIMYSINPSINSWNELYQTSTSAMQTASNDLAIAISEMENKMDNTLNQAGIDYKDFDDTVNEELDSVSNKSSATVAAVEKMKKDSSKALSETVTAVQTFETNFNSSLQKVMDKINGTNGMIATLNALAGAAQNALDKQKALYSYKPPTTTGGDGNGNVIADVDTKNDQTPLASGAYATNSKITGVALHNGRKVCQVDNQWWYSAPWINGGKAQYGDTATFSSEFAYNNHYESGGDEYANGGYSFKSSGEKAPGSSAEFKIGPEYFGLSTSTDARRTLKKGTDDYYYVKALTSDKWYRVIDLIPIHHNKDFYYSIVKGVTPVYYMKFDTGGYTGDWGPEGKLAMLHQKEIVLNAHDTENLLSIISMVRDMNDRINLNAKAMQYELSSAALAASVKDHAIQQEVHITAEFPNATNHNEIEEAFKNLANYTTQYIHQR